MKESDGESEPNQDTLKVHMEMSHETPRTTNIC
jgi:hypothetical protein